MTRRGQNLDQADLLKFIMSVFIVATHSGLFSGYITAPVRLAVPVFFILSGYFFFYKLSLCSDEKEKTAYLKKTVFHNLRMYLFWFIVLLPITLHIRGYHKVPFLEGLRLLSRDFLFGSTFQSSWYITALVAGLIIMFYLSRYLKSRSLLLVGVLMYIPSLLASNYYFIIAGNDTLTAVYNSLHSVFLLPCRNFSTSIIFLSLGKILFEKREEPLRKDKVLLPLCCAAYICEWLLLEFSSAEIINTDSFIMLPPVAYYLCRIVLSRDMKIPFAGRLRSFSTLSYCSHMAVFMVAGKVFSLLELPDFQNILLFAVTLTVTYILSAFILSLEKTRLLRFLRYSH